MVPALLGVVILLINIMIWVIIIQAVFSWLVAFNVINTYNNGVRQFLYLLERITDPLYRPVRAFMPDFGGIDFSPIVVILLLHLLARFLMSLQLQAVGM
ncbi:YggT family protein [Parasphingopyxis algicola]|uniref:YggT family protein n=1 Tax=Parasphingopyxis algicola TaxID=2026624 RepID=UPI0015A24A5C|nr:YggT family protein [Parasphingopyxis algicola]QLC25531.1 YggT family protein [Parasphingopyxis algicola]